MSKYKIIYQKNKQLDSIILDDIQDSSKLPDNIIQIKKLQRDKIELKNIFVRSKELYSLFYELNTMLQANLTLMEAITILKKNKYDHKTSMIIDTFYTSLLNGQYIHKNLQKHEEILGKLTIEFIKIGELNGNIKQAINSITKIMEQTSKNKKRIMKSFSYPIILCLSLFLSIFSIFTFVIPKFESLYSQFDSKLPLSTYYLLQFKSLFDTYFIPFILLIISLSFIFNFYYKKSITFKEKLDRFLLTKVPLISKMFLISNSSNFFFSLSTLLEDKHQFFDSLSNSKTLISNRYLYLKISQIEEDIKNGKNISKAFEDSKLFDDLTIRLINTGEKSNNLTLTLSKIDTIYKEKLNNSLQNFITVFEPTIIAIIASFILWLTIAIFTPIWDMSTIIK